MFVSAPFFDIISGLDLTSSTFFPAYLIYPMVLNPKFVFVILVTIAVLVKPIFEQSLRHRFGDGTISVYRMIYNILVVAVFGFSVLYFMPQYSEYLSLAFDFMIF